MKSFMMRGVILVALLYLLVLPASAAWSNTDSNNLATIKTYTSNIYTVLNQSSLGSRLSSIVSNTQNTANYLSTISARIGTSNTWPTINGQLTKIIGQNSDSYTRLGDVRSYLLDIRTTVSNIYTKMGTGGSSADLTTVNNNTNKLVTRADTMVSSLSQIEIKTKALIPAIRSSSSFSANTAASCISILRRSILIKSSVISLIPWCSCPACLAASVLSVPLSARSPLSKRPRRGIAALPIT